MLLLLLSCLITAGLFVWGTWEHKKDVGTEGIAGYVFGVILTFVLIITSIAIPIGNAARLQSMLAFSEANTQNYAITFEKTKVILSEEQFISQALIPVEGSIEKFKIADTVANRLVEWRDEVNQFNRDLLWMRYANGNVWIGIYYPDVPGDLKLLVIE